MLVSRPQTHAGEGRMENLEAKRHRLTYLPATEPLQAAIPTQDTEDWLPLRWAALQLDQGPSVLTDSGQLLWKTGPSDVRATGQCPGVQTTWTVPTVSQVSLCTGRLMLNEWFMNQLTAIVIF